MLRTNSRLVTLLVLVLILTTACMPFSLELDGSTDTQETVERDLTELRSEKTEGGETAPVLYASTPVASLGQQTESFQDTLIRLYQAVNPSVVYIIVSSSSSGSGFVYSEEGHIVTNHHVATAGRDLEVVFAGGERMQATLVGADADSDLAVIKVDGLPDGIRPLPLAEADGIQVGQFAIAIGNPFGEQGSMSLGIVSGLGRSLRSQRATTALSTYSLPQVIQTDAPINPGNSGGPLLNLDGEVIGVNAAIASTTGSNTGVGFSIPVAAVKRIVPDLIEKGEHSYAYMGASFDSEISLGEQTVYGVPQTQGAYVISVTPGGPADRAGLIAADPRTGEGGDLIVEIDGQPILDFSDLNSYLVFETQVGQTIEVTVLRDGEFTVLPLTLGARP
jgi:S1-C subfamily serine protease